MSQNTCLTPNEVKVLLDALTRYQEFLSREIENGARSTDKTYDTYLELSTVKLIREQALSLKDMISEAEFVLLR